MAEIDILLAAYNGEKYIAEQIDSILGQTFKDFRLIIRDDDSTDRTPEIIEEYAKKYPGIIEVVHDDAVCRYHAKNFFQLLKHAEADYVMFCDQDDYWLKWKIDVTLDYMKKTEKENPGKGVLVFTGLHVADNELNSMDKFMACELEKYRYSFSELLDVVNCVTGCTVMINRRIYTRLGEYSDSIKNHDYWVALYASACGVVCHVPMALMLYRQHKNNAIGYIEHSRAYKLRLRIKRIKNFLKDPAETFREFYDNFNNMRRTYTLFRDRYACDMYPEALQHLNNFLDTFSSSLITRFKALRKTKYRLQYRIVSKGVFYLSLITYKPD